MAGPLAKGATVMKTALIVVDAQRIYTNPDSEMFCADAKNTMRRINDLIRRFEERGAPIVLVRHVHKRDGSDLGRLFDYTGEPADDFNFKDGTEEVEYDPTLVIPKKSMEFIKNRYSAFAGTGLDDALRRDQVRRVAICGFMTNFCCESTARTAHDLDYYVDFMVDATGTPGIDKMDEKEIRRVVGDLLGEGFARVFLTKKYLSIS